MKRPSYSSFSPSSTLSKMAPREQVKSDVLESRVGEGELEWFRRRFNIPSDYTLSVTDKKAHEP